MDPVRFCACNLVSYKLITSFLESVGNIHTFYRNDRFNENNIVIQRAEALAGQVRKESLPESERSMLELTGISGKFIYSIFFIVEGLYVFTCYNQLDRLLTYVGGNPNQSQNRRTKAF